MRYELINNVYNNFERYSGIILFWRTHMSKRDIFYKHGQK